MSETPESTHADRELPPRVVVGERFERAAAWMVELHALQARKGPRRLPYVSHLLAVAGLVLEDDGSEDEAIAALLHDSIEDQGDRATRDEIKRRFGERVAEIVGECTDARSENLSSSERKDQHLAHLARVGDQGVLRVVLADKLHNARSIVRDLAEEGASAWERFNTDREGQLSYYGRLAEVFSRSAPGPMSRELEQLVEYMQGSPAEAGGVPACG